MKIEIAGITIDAEKYLSERGYTDFQMNEYEGGGHYGLPISRVFECKDSSGKLVGVEQEARRILTKRIRTLVNADE